MHNWYQNCIFINRLKPNVMDNVKVNFKGSPVTLVGTHLQTGDKAPRFTVLDGDLQPVSLSQHKNVFALPKASTTCMYIPITATSTSV